MTSSAMQGFLSEVLGGNRIPGNKLAYFQTRLSSNIHQAMLGVFGRIEKQGDFTRKDLAHRIGRKPEQITRWFSYPGNLTLGTVSDILLGMGYEVESVTLVDLATGNRVQYPDHHIDWVRLAGLYASEEESTASLPLPQPRDALGDQPARASHQSAESQWMCQSTRPTALQGMLSGSSTVGKAEAAQLISKSSNAQVGQAA